MESPVSDISICLTIYTALLLREAAKNTTRGFASRTQVTNLPERYFGRHTKNDFDVKYYHYDAIDGRNETG
jgi:hypothetical protein